MENARERILVVVAHPDDAEFFLGGTLIMKARQGAVIRVVIATDGRWGSFLLPSDELAIRRRVEAARAAAHYRGEVKFIGPDGLGYPDGSLATLDFAALCEQVVAHIREFRPTCIATFNPDVLDGHPDHDTIGRVTVAAMHFAELPNAYRHQIDRGLSPHAVSARILFAKEPQCDNFVFDITPVIKEKVAAVLEHESQSVFLVSQLLAQARSAGVDLSWLPDEAASPEVAAALLAHVVRDWARAAALRRPLGRLRGWLTGCRYAESVYYTPLPPVVADVAARARTFGRLRGFLEAIHAERLWTVLRRLIARRLVQKSG